MIGFIPLKLENKVELVRGRLTSAAVAKDNKGKRNKLLGKNVYLSLHRNGEVINNVGYWGLLEKKFQKTYTYKELTGSSDGASNMKTVVEASGALHNLSKFHWKRRLEGIEGKNERLKFDKDSKKFIDTWKRKEALGYWSESDIAHVLRGLLGKGNRVFTLKSCINYLRAKGVNLLETGLLAR